MNISILAQTIKTLSTTIETILPWNSGMVTILEMADNESAEKIIEQAEEYEPEQVKVAQYLINSGVLTTIRSLNEEQDDELTDALND